MMEIIFLGTSSMQPTKKRNHSSFLLRYKDENILFDCGEGTQRQMRIAGLKPAKITKILISHWHGDHIFGLPGVLSAMAADHFTGTLYLYGPRGTKAFLSHLLQSYVSKERITIAAKDVEEGVFFEGKDFFLEAQPLQHATRCLGFSFQEKERRKIDMRKAKKLGLKEGPLLGTLQQGQPILWQGKKIRPEAVTTLLLGRKISYIADTLPCPGANRLAKNADILISEGTHLDELRESSKRYMHLTVKEAAQIAAKNKAKNLIITHLSQRYKNVEEILKEAQTYFPNSVVAEDFLTIKLEKGGEQNSAQKQDAQRAKLFGVPKT